MTEAPRSPAPGSDDAEALVERVLAGEAVAWTGLWARIEPRLSAIVSGLAALKPLVNHADDCRNVVLEVMQKLREDDHRRLRVFQKVRVSNPGLPLMAWVSVLARRIAIDYLRAHGEYLDNRHRDDTGPGRFISPVTLPSESGLPIARPAFTDLGTAREMLRYAAEVLPADQRRALMAWLHGFDFVAIAATLGLSGEKPAERLVRAALERLRRHFKEKKP